MTSIFLSFASADREIVMAVARALHADAVDVWVDQWELNAGADLVAGIQQGIADADTFCVVVSRHSARSPWVEREIAYARARASHSADLRLLAIVLDRQALPVALEGVPLVDFTGGLETGLTGLRAALGALSVRRTAGRLAEIVVTRRGPPTVRPSSLEMSDGSPNRIGVVTLETDTFALAALVECTGERERACALTREIARLLITTLNAVDVGTAKWMSALVYGADVMAKALNMSIATHAVEQRVSCKMAVAAVERHRIRACGLGSVGAAWMRFGARPRTEITSLSGAHSLDAMLVRGDNQGRFGEAPLGVLAGAPTPTLIERPAGPDDAVVLTSFLAAMPARDPALAGFERAAGALAAANWPPFEHCVAVAMRQRGA